MYRIRLTVAPAQGYVGGGKTVSRAVFVPYLRVGSRGPSVYALEQRLHELHYDLGAADGYYGVDTADAVVAFQKLHGLARTGATDARFWRGASRLRTSRPATPAPACTSR